MDGDQLLPGAGRVARRPGGRDVRGPRRRRERPAPRPARDGGARRLAVRLLHAGVRLPHGRGVLPRRARRDQRHRPPDRHDDGTHGENGFDLHAISGNLCRCTGYRPIKDAAFALGLPGRGRHDRRAAYAARTRGPRPPGCTTARRRSSGRPTSPRRCGVLARPPGRVRRRRQHRLGRRGQPQGPPGRARGRRRPAARAARLLGHRRRGPDRRRAHPHRGRTAARRPAAAAAGADAAVRLAADPQRRHAGRQPRHRLADRRRAAGAARPRGLARAGLDRGRADRAARRLLHRLPRVRPRAGRADHRGRRAAAGRARSPRSTRSPSARFDDISSVAVGFALDVADGVVTQGADRPRRRRRHADPGARDRGRPRGPAVDRGDRRRGRRRCWPARARRSPTSGPAPSSGRRCSARRCASCSTSPGQEVTRHERR